MDPEANAAVREQLTKLCEQFGAAPLQAAVMAGQLLKRADQLAAERATTRAEVLSHLIEVVSRGRRGEAPPAGGEA